MAKFLCDSCGESFDAEVTGFYCPNCREKQKSIATDEIGVAIPCLKGVVLRASKITPIDYAVCCLICGEFVYSVPYLKMSRLCICDKCKAAVMKVREQYERTSTD